MIDLYWDTETTGLIPRFDGPHTQPGMPRVCQIACVLWDHDLKKDLASFQSLVRCEVDPHPKAMAVHKISRELSDKGVAPLAALGTFVSMMYRANRLVAYNVDFDLKMMLSEAHLVDRPALKDAIAKKERHCVMKEAAEHLKLPGIHDDEYRWPKLEQSYKHFFERDFEGAHDAMADIRATMDAHHEMMRLDAEQTEQAAAAGAQLDLVEGEDQ